MSEIQTKVGLDVLRNQPGIALEWGRCGYVSNQASITCDWRHGVDVLDSVLGQKFTTIFGPQHGFSGTAQDNMIETDHTKDSKSSRSIFSLYSETREPTEFMMQELDTIVVDLQIVGCRVYTFKSTIAGCLRSAKRYGKRVVVLDRPNPLGGLIVEGRCVEEGMKSFVGQFSIPMRHGLSSGEAATFFNQGIGAELEVVKLKNWQLDKDWTYTNRPWVLTSPNLPTLTPLFLYPGTVAFEGCNISEGRGTGLPFEFFGSPHCPSSLALIQKVEHYLGGKPAGLHLRAAEFQPTSGKWANQNCVGLQVHVIQAQQVASYSFGLALIKSFEDLCGEQFEFTSQTYEYEYQKLAIDLILGGEASTAHLKNFDVRDQYWRWGIEDYLNNVESSLLYNREMQEVANFTEVHQH